MLFQSLDKIGIVKEYQNLNTTLGGMTDSVFFNQFTVSEDGLYEVKANLYGSKLSSSRTLIGVRKNDFTITTEHNGDGYYGVEASRIFECSSGDVISGVFYNSVPQSANVNNLVCQIIRLK